VTTGSVGRVVGVLLAPPGPSRSMARPPGVSTPALAGMKDCWTALPSMFARPIAPVVVGALVRLDTLQ